MDVPFRVRCENCGTLPPAACLKSLNNPNDGGLQEFFPIRKSGLIYVWSRLTREYESSLIRLFYDYLNPGTLLENRFVITSFHTLLIIKLPVEIHQPSPFVSKFVS